MLEYDQSINQHYGQADLSTRILSALQEAGKNIDALTRADLSTFDEFHFGGIEQTRHLARLTGLGEGMTVLDVGSGLGGPARTLAAEFGCQVTGLDLTAEYVRAAEMLTARTGLTSRVVFQQGNTLDMHFPDSTFDVVWTQFAGMNMEDKARLYDEFRRVLKDSGRLAFHEVMAGSVSHPHYPAFWANDASLSFLRAPEDVRQLLTDRGFQEVAMLDLTQPTTDWIRSVITRNQQEVPRPLDVNVFVAENVSQKVANVLQNLEENRIVVVMGVYELTKL